MTTPSVVDLAKVSSSLLPLLLSFGVQRKHKLEMLLLGMCRHRGFDTLQIVRCDAEP